VYKLGDKKSARELADAVLAKKMNHPLASYVKAQLLKGAGDEDKAIALLEAAVDKLAPEVKVLRLLGTLQFEGKKFAEAARTFELARTVEPKEPEWMTQLARTYVHTKETDKRIEVLKELVPTNADDLETRRQLAELLLTAKRPAEAERFAREALEIDVLHPEAQDLLRQA